MSAQISLIIFTANRSSSKFIFVRLQNLIDLCLCLLVSNIDFTVWHHTSLVMYLGGYSWEVLLSQVQWDRTIDQGNMSQVSSQNPILSHPTCWLSIHTWLMDILWQTAPFLFTVTKKYHAIINICWIIVCSSVLLMLRPRHKLLCLSSSGKVFLSTQQTASKLLSLLLESQ